LVPGAEHALRRNAAELALADLNVARQSTTAHDQRHSIAYRQILCGGNDRRHTVSPIDLQQEQVIGIWMARQIDDLPDDNSLPIATDLDDRLGFGPGHRQAMGELSRRKVNVDELAQPAQWYLHRNC